MWWIVLAGLPVVVLVALLLPIRRTPRITFMLERGNLRLEQSASDGIYCLKRRLDLPLSQILGVTVAPRQIVPHAGLRLPGTSVPGVIRAGSYGTGAARDFWNVRRSDTVLVIQMRPGASYRRVILEVEDPEAEAARLTPGVGAYDGEFSA